MTRQASNGPTTRGTRGRDARRSTPAATTATWRAISGDLAGIHAVIAGGETGPGARPANPDWFRRVRDDCAEAGVPFFLKDLGGVKRSGHVLDGRTHRELPKWMGVQEGTDRG